jgi:hypothetical protein
MTNKLLTKWIVDVFEHFKWIDGIHREGFDAELNQNYD